MPPLPLTAADMLDAAGIDPDIYRDVMPRVDAALVRIRRPSRLSLTLWAKGISAITTPWGVYVHPATLDRYLRGERLASTGRLMLHELMHVEQLARMGVIAHTIQYATDYIRGRATGRGHWDAYREVRLEQEARAAARMISERMA